MTTRGVQTSDFADLTGECVRKSEALQVWCSGNPQQMSETRADLRVKIFSIFAKDIKVARISSFKLVFYNLPLAKDQQLLRTTTAAVAAPADAENASRDDRIYLNQRYLQQYTHHHCQHQIGTRMVTVIETGGSCNLYSSVLSHHPDPLILASAASPL